MTTAFWRNLFLMTFILSPALILFGMILFSGKPKDQIPMPPEDSGKADEQ